MADAQSAERACKDPNPIIDGRKANVNLAYLGAKPRTVQEALCLPIALKAGLPSISTSNAQYGLPQYGLYPTAYLQTAAGLVPVHVPPTTGLSQTAQLQQYIDYQHAASAAAIPSLRLTPTAIDMASAAGYSFGTAAAVPAGAASTAGLVSPTALYSYAALSPHQLLAAYQQQQQLQERM